MTTEKEGLMTDERRNCLRCEKFFPVLIESPMCGYINCIARNVSMGGLFLETRTPLPLGSPLRLYFSLPNGQSAIAAEGQVKNHYFLNFGSIRGPSSLTGMGIRFLGFEDDGAEKLEQTLKVVRPMH
jgi:hypothetical protein